MIEAKSPDHFLIVVKRLAEEFGLRFLWDKDFVQYAKGFSDPEAWIDLKVPGIMKLNCMVKVSAMDYQWVRGAQWAKTRPNKRVQRPGEYKYGRLTKGVDGLVIDNGEPTEIARQVLEQWGSNMVNEHYRAVLYENYLYKPTLMNLEFEINNTKDPSNKKTLSLNVHVATAFR